MAKTHCWCGEAVAWKGAALCKGHNDQLVSGLTGIRDVIERKGKK